MAWSAATNPRGPPTGILAAGILSPVAGLVSKPREQRAPSKGILTAGILSPVADLLPRVKRSFSTQSLTDVTEYIGITKSHWVNAADRKVCLARSCRVKFSIVNSPQNCHRCGEVYCKKCLKQQRRLNIFANYDPQGKFYKVCENCFHSEQQSLGATRSVMNEYRHIRTAHRKYDRSVQRSSSMWNEAEDRICIGYLAELNSTHSLVRMVQSMTVTFVKGSWMKPSSNGKNESVCWGCTKEFELIFRHKHTCSICGGAVCDECSSKDLLVYVPDELVEEEDNSCFTTAKLCLIKVQGSPGTEPEVCEYLRICNNCHQTKKEKQLQQLVRGRSNTEAHDEFWSTLRPFHDKLLSDQRQIEQSLQKYETLVRSLEDGSQRTSFGSNVQVLSKAQIDLNDLFYHYLISFSKIKRFKPLTPNTETLIRNMLKSTARFYGENNTTFLELKKLLEEHLPAEAIATIQDQVNKNTLELVHVLIKQLAFEVLMYADKGIENIIIIAEKFANAEQIVADERRLLHQSDEEWEETLSACNNMVKLQLKDKEHRLIKASPSVLSQPDYLLNLIVERSCQTLEKITAQLTAKTTHSSYQTVKQTINELSEDILKLVCSTS